MNLSELTEKIIEYCKENSIKKIYLCGQGGSGKTTLSKSLYEYATNYGKVNLISLDDFLVDIELRKNATIHWSENDIEYSHRYTSSNVESYFLKNVYEILYNLEHNLDCYYFPRRYKEKNNIRRLYSDNFLTIIEGIGVAFLDIPKENSISIFLKCSKEDEIIRREERAKQKNWPSIELYDEKRSSQFRVNVLPKEKEFNLIIQNDNNFNYEIIQNQSIPPIKILKK